MDDQEQRWIDDFEESWAIERGQKKSITSEHYDARFETPRVEWDLLDAVTSKGSLVGSFNNLLVKTPRYVYNIMGLAWLLSIYLTSDLLWTKIFRVWYGPDTNLTTFWMILFSAYFLFSAFIVSFFIAGLSRKRLLSKSTYPEKEPIIYLSIRRLAMPVGVAAILTIALLGYTYLPFKPIVTEYGVAFVDNKYVETVTANDPVYTIDIREDLASENSKEELNANLVVALERKDRMKAIEYATLSNKYHSGEPSEAFDLNLASFSLPFKIRSLYGFHEKSSFAEASKNLENSIPIVPYDSGNRPTRTELNALALALEDQGYAKKAREIFKEELFQTGLNDSLVESNYAKFVSNNCNYLFSPAYSKVNINDSIRWVDSSYYEKSRSFLANGNVNLTRYYLQLMKENNVEVLNSVAVENEIKEDWARAIVGYFVADQKDPFDMYQSVGYNYRRSFDNLQIKLENNERYLSTIVRNSPRFMLNEQTLTWEELMLAQTVRKAVYAEERNDYSNAFELYKSVLPSGDPAVRWNFNEFIKYVNISKLEDDNTQNNPDFKLPKR